MPVRMMKIRSSKLISILAHIVALEVAVVRNRERYGRLAHHGLNILNS